MYGSIKLDALKLLSEKVSQLLVPKPSPNCISHKVQSILESQYKYRIAGNFRGEIFSWFSIIKFIRGKKFVVYSSVLSQLNHKIKSSWVKHSWFYLNHENHEIFSPRKFPAIR